MAGHRFIQIITGLSNMKSHLCVWGKGRKREKKKNRGKERCPFIFPVNHFHCHLNLSLRLQRTSRLLIWNNKQKRVNIQLIKMSAGAGRAYSSSCSVGLQPALSSRNPNHTLIHKLQTKSPLWLGRDRAGTANWRCRGTATRQLEGNPADRER